MKIAETCFHSKEKTRTQNAHMQKAEKQKFEIKKSIEFKLTNRFLPLKKLRDVTNVTKNFSQKQKR